MITVSGLCVAAYHLLTTFPYPAMLPKLIVTILLVAIVISLFSALFFMLKDSSKSKRTVRALTARVGLQVALIVFLLIATFMGWIRPHGIGG